MLRASKQQNPEQFSEQVFKARYGFGQNGVNGPVLDVLRNQSRRREDGEQASEDRHRAERNIFQDLEFLLKRKPRQEDRAADQDQGKNKQEIENLLPGQIGQSVAGNRKDARRRESAMTSRGHTQNDE